MMTNKEILKKQIIYRSMHRGTKEMDLLLGNFVKKYIDVFDYNELLNLYEILEKDLEKRRLSLSYKNTLINPWVKFTKEHKVNDVFEGVVKNITDYALFIAIKDSELDGMIHYKDLSWSEKDSELQKYKKNQLVKFNFKISSFE